MIRRGKFLGTNSRSSIHTGVKHIAIVNKPLIKFLPGRFNQQVSISLMEVINSNSMKLINYPFGILFAAIGTINLFWGNDPFFGIFILLCALLYFPPVESRIEKITGFRVRTWMKIVLGLFIIWASAGVGELFDKIDLMRNSF